MSAPARKTAATKLVELALSNYELGVSRLGKPFVRRAGHHVVRLLRGGTPSLRTELAGSYFETTGSTASENALAEAMKVLEHKASQSEPVQLHLRSTTEDGVCWIDLGDTEDRVARITRDGWEVLDESPVLFYRTTLTMPFPVPTRGGALDELWDFATFTESDRPLFLAWTLAVHLNSDQPVPVAAIVGEQGTAKSSSTRRLVQMADPSSAPVRPATTDENKWEAALAHSRVAAFDNLSSISPATSDNLCRAVTGDARVERVLYTDEDVRVSELKRAVVFNAITVGALRGDLAERIVKGELERIDPAKRRTETDLERAWSSAYPGLFGALLDLMSDVLRELPGITLERYPRMADYALILAAVDAVLGTDGLARYWEQQEVMADEQLESDAFLDALTSAITEPWEGTARDLMRLIPKPDHDRFWPATAHGYSGKLKRCAPALRLAGWQIEGMSASPKQTKVWRLTPPARDEAGHHLTEAVRLYREVHEFAFPQFASSIPLPARSNHDSDERYAESVRQAAANLLAITAAHEELPRQLAEPGAQPSGTQSD